jgi:hypothetical protein
MVPIRVRFSPGFLQEQDFPGRNLIRADHGGKTGFPLSKLLQRGARSTAEHSSQDWEPAGAASAENSLGEELLRSSRSTLEQIPPREILLLEEIPGQSAHGLAPLLKSSLWKIKIKRNPLNFKSIQWNHLQAFPIPWDYPFKAKIAFFVLQNWL